MTSRADRASTSTQVDASSVATIADLATVLRNLRRREARLRQGEELTYLQLAERTGWSVSVIGAYMAGTALPSTTRFDTLVQLLGAGTAELGALSDAWDRVAEARRAERREPEPDVAWSTPEELPAAPSHFVGRAEELARLDHVAFEGNPAEPHIAVVTGMGGVGKSALVTLWAHQAAQQFPDGQLYVNLRGYDPTEPVDPTDALAGFLRSLGVSPAELPLDESERTVRYRTLLSRRRVLIVLDNARDAEQMRPLLPGSPQCMVVVTSRDLLAGIVSSEGAVRVPLDLLSMSESTALVHKVAAVRFDGAPYEAESLARHCGGLPLAIRVAAEVAARRADVSVTELVEDLRDERFRLDVLDTGEARTTMRSVLSWSYRSLSAEGARLFRLLGCACGPDLSTAAVASLGELTPIQTRRLLTELTHSHMLTETASGRYGMHDVLRAYAAELAHDIDREPGRDAAVHRLLDHYLGTAVLAERQHRPNRFNDAPDFATPADFPFVVQIDSAEDARRWFDQERAALLAAVPLAVEHGYSDHAWQLPWAMMTLLDLGGYWHELAAASAMALEVATAPAARACIHDLLARAAFPLRQTDTAVEHCERALELLEALGDEEGQARLHSSLSQILGEAGRTRQAADHSRLTLELCRRLGNVVGQSASLNNIGMCHVQLGEYSLALTACHEALALVQEHGHRSVEACVLDSLGLIHRKMVEYEQAIDYYHRSLTLFEEIGDRPNVADQWMSLGDTHAELGQHDVAAHAWQMALTILDELDHPAAALVRTRLETGAPPH